MKLNEIAKIVSKTKSVVVIEDSDGHVWIGDNKSLYYNEDNIPFEKQNVIAILGIDPKKRDEYTVRKASVTCNHISLDVNMATDKPLEVIGDVNIGSEQMILMAEADSGKLHAAPHRRLKAACTGSQIDRILYAWEMGDDGEKVIIVCDAAYVYGIIYDCWSAIRESMENMANAILRQADE